MSYGPNLRAVFRRFSSLVDRILKGPKAADVPIEIPTIFELVVNMRTAKAIGVAVPQSVLVRADRVIEESREWPLWVKRDRSLGVDCRSSRRAAFRRCEGQANRTAAGQLRTFAFSRNTEVAVAVSPQGVKPIG